MPVINIPSFSTENVDKMDIGQLRNAFIEMSNNYNKMAKELNFALNKLDTRNVKELNADRLVAESITTDKLAAAVIIAEKIAAGAIETDKLAAGAVTANKIDVNQLSAISADVGELTAGIITGILLRTAAEGARVEQNEGKIYIYQSDGSLRILIDSTESPPKINFYDGGILVAGITYIGGTLTVSSDTGAIFGKNGQDTTMAGRTVFGNWGNLYNASSGETLQQALNDKAPEGNTDSVTVGDGAGGTITLHFDNGSFTGTS